MKIESENSQILILKCLIFDRKHPFLEELPEFIPYECHCLIIDFLIVKNEMFSTAKFSIDNKFSILHES